MYKTNPFAYRYHKYHAQKTQINGMTYDSKKEAKRALELEHLERIGIIHNLQKQVRFELQEPYTNNKGEKIRAITYVADFVYEKNGQKIVEDTKGIQTDVFKIKKKMFEKKYPEFYFWVS
jgi:hypothetical protein